MAVKETAERLMDVAEAHMHSARYGGFSFRDLAAEIGIKSASVHHHFPTKTTMAAAVARRYADRFIAAVAWRPNETADDAIATYRATFKAALNRDGQCASSVCRALKQAGAIEGRRRLAEGTSTVRMENRFRHKDGSYRWLYWTLTAEQGLIYVVGRNVTADKAAAQAHRRTEEQLRQLQKLDSVGQLTGGIAHDFNNLLTVIIGNLEILGRLLGTTSARVSGAVTAAMTGATRAATLTQRLLAYAQKQPLRPQAVSVDELVTGMADLIRRTQGEAIVYEFALGENLPLCFCDANQVETSLLNLVLTH
jgi:signal transduction histidine kinase